MSSSSKPGYVRFEASGEKLIAALPDGFAYALLVVPEGGTPGFLMNKPESSAARELMGYVRRQTGVAYEIIDAAKIKAGTEYKVLCTEDDYKAFFTEFRHDRAGIRPVVR